MMLDIVQEENARLKADLSVLRRVIVQVEPVVLMDGRFEAMMVSPGKAIAIACDILRQTPRQAIHPAG